MKRLQHLLWIVTNWYGYLLGFPLLASFHQAIALLGLHGLGYDNRFGGNLTGEGWFIKKVLPKIGDAACIDIGAHVGLYSELLTRHVSGEVYAVEPLSSSYTQLVERATPRVHPFQLAITNFDGKAPIYSRKEKGEDATLREDAMTDHRIAEEIPVSTLDSFVAANHISNLGFVKIDTEGHEFEVLSGMQQLLHTRPPQFVQFEFNFHHVKRGHTLLMLTELLPGYRFYRLVAHGMLPINPEKYIDNLFMYSNVIAERIA